MAIVYCLVLMLPTLYTVFFEDPMTLLSMNYYSDAYGWILHPNYYHLLTQRAESDRSLRHQN